MKDLRWILDIVLIPNEEMGSGEKWIGWIMLCISRVRFFMLVSRTPSALSCFILRIIEGGFIRDLKLWG
ncbi:hypothetical protein AAG906_003874 [Vitis piasezkii]